MAFCIVIISVYLLPFSSSSPKKVQKFIQGGKPGKGKRDEGTTRQKRDVLTQFPDPHPEHHVLPRQVQRLSLVVRGFVSGRHARGGVLIGGRSEGGGGTSRGEVVRRGGRLAGGRRPLRWGVVDGRGGVRREGLQLLLLRAYEREKPVLRPHISTSSLSPSIHGGNSRPDPPPPTPSPDAVPPD